MRLLFLYVSVILCLPISARAQGGEQAKAILNAVSKKYQSYHIAKASFTYTIESPQANFKESGSGTFYIKPRLNQYKVILKGQEIICDGESLWTYLKKENEVQRNTIDPSDALNPANILNIYEKGFKYLYTGASMVNNRTVYTIDLIPTENKRSFFKIRLNIDKQNSQITKALVFEKNGNRYMYSMKPLIPQNYISDSFFDFDIKKYPNIELVDLR